MPVSSGWPEGIDELENVEYSVTESGVISAAVAGNGHDDIVLSLALAAWHRRPKQESTISTAPMPMLVVGEPLEEGW